MSNPNSPRLPQSGWWTDEEWADALGEDIRTFRRKCAQSGVPRKKWGHLVMVRAEDFFLHAPGDDNAEETG